MNWIVNIILVICAIIAFLAGNRPGFSFNNLNSQALLNSLLGILLFFTLLMILHFFGLFPQVIAAPFMMCFYTLIAGFLGGYSWRLYRLRKNLGTMLYQHRTFWTDHAPALLAVVLILYGLFRTSLLTEQIVTGIRLTSGFSLMTFGMAIWMLKTVPEFRSKGVLLLDKKIGWHQIVSWNWQSERVIAIEYLTHIKREDGRILQFLTSVPEEDRKELEIVLRSKMEEYAEERKKMLFPDENENNA